MIILRRVGRNRKVINRREEIGERMVMRGKERVKKDWNSSNQMIISLKSS
jgi:hypothetical protein